MFNMFEESELIKERNKLLVKTDREENYTNNEELNIDLKYLAELEDKIVRETRVRVDSYQKKMTQEVNKMVNGKELKKELMTEYKKIRDEYTAISDKLKANVKEKKKFRDLMSTVDNIRKDETQTTDNNEQLKKVEEELKTYKAE